jgi:hypothetical protein
MLFKPARTPGAPKIGRQWRPQAPQMSSNGLRKSLDFEIGVRDRLRTLRVPWRCMVAVQRAQQYVFFKPARAPGTPKIGQKWGAPGPQDIPRPLQKVGGEAPHLLKESPGPDEAPVGRPEGEEGSPARGPSVGSLVGYSEQAQHRFNSAACRFSRRHACMTACCQRTHQASWNYTGASGAAQRNHAPTFRCMLSLAAFLRLPARIFFVQLAAHFLMLRPPFVAFEIFIPQFHFIIVDQPLSPLTPRVVPTALPLQRYELILAGTISSSEPPPAAPA